MPEFDRNRGLRSFPWFWVSLLILWAPALYLLAGQWSAFPEYNYGWSVPFLSIYLIKRRLEGLPKNAGGLGGGALDGRVLFPIALSLAMLLLPLYVLQDANLIWRAASWGLGLCLVSLSLALIALCGGGRVARHLAGPFLLFLTAIPWPTAMEHCIVDLLTRFNSTATVETLVFFGIPTVQRGNVIELASGLVGIDDACSGIRSLQANVMLALFFGEYRRLGWRRRVSLVGWGVLFALAFNYSRTLLLTSIAATQGLTAMQSWHDLAGTLVLLACFTSLWMVSKFGDDRKSGGVSVAGPGELPRRVGECSDRNISSPRLRFVLIGLAAWGLMVPGLAEIWFRLHEQTKPGEHSLAVVWPPPGLRHADSAPLGSAVRRQLAFDEGGSIRWRDADGIGWQAFYFRWKPARSIFRRVQVQFAKSHRPEFCLPASGRVLKEQRIITLHAAGARIPFRFYRFEDGARALHVYLHARDESMPLGNLANMRSDSRDRLAAAWSGNRAAGQQTLEFAVWGISDERESQSRLERLLPGCFAPDQFYSGL